MVKARTTISIDNNLLEEAKAKLINISGLVESSIRGKLGKIEVDVPEELVCHFCGKEGVMETSDNVQPTTNTKNRVKYPHLLSLLSPDEKFICNHCLRKITKSVRVATK